MNTTTQEFLQHHGIKGQKWGVRRYQNKDGTLTIQGKKRSSRDTTAKKNIQPEIKKLLTISAIALREAFVMKNSKYRVALLSASVIHIGGAKL